MVAATITTTIMITTMAMVTPIKQLTVTDCNAMEILVSEFRVLELPV